MLVIVDPRPATRIGPKAQVDRDGRHQVSEPSARTALRCIGLPVPARARTSSNTAFQLHFRPMRSWYLTIDRPGDPLRTPS